MSWWKNLGNRRSQEAELDAELRFHVERQIQQYVDDGLTPSAARRRALLEFGALTLAKEECRDVRPLQWLADGIRDIRLGFRALGRDRAFAISVTAILAMGIGAAVSMFSILNAVVLRPLPYADPDRLVTLSTMRIPQNQWDGTSVPNFSDWRDQGASFAGMTYYRRTQASQVTFAAADAPRRAQEGQVAPDFFDLLGTPPLLGRTFTRHDSDREDCVVVLSQNFWEEQFGADPNVLGRKLSIDGRNHVVIGVMPRSFQLPTSDTRFWRLLPVALPQWSGVRTARDGDLIEVIGRLRPGVRLQDARARMAVIAARLRAAYPVDRDLDVRVTPLFDHVVGEAPRRGVWLGFAAVMSLLAIACANAGGLLAARAARRRRELAVRAALGAGRSRLIRQLLAESVSIWAFASLAGLLLAWASIRLLLTYGPRTLPRLEQVRLDGLGLAVAFLGGLAVVLLTGTIPALLAARADSSSAFVRGRPGSPRRRLQDLVVTGQIAGALTLLVGALLFAESFLRAQTEDPGFPAANLLVVQINGRSARGFFHAAQESIGSLPGVVAVGGIKQFLLKRNPDQQVTIEGGTRHPGPPKLSIDAVTPGYFRSMDIDLVEGRDFEERDLQPGMRVSIVNETMARNFWPGESALGKRWIGGGSPPADGRWNTVIGVVADMRREGLDRDPIAAAFVPDLFSGNFDMTVRTAAGAAGLIPAVRRELRAIDGSLPVPEIATAAARLSERIGGRRFETQLLGVFAAIALLLAAAGLYGCLAYQVALRTREIGIRCALGASRGAVMAMIVERGMRLALAGAGLGLLAAWAAARLMQGLLYQTPAVDHAGYAAAVVLMLLVSAAAAWIPARRAAAVDPITVLREE